MTIKETKIRELEGKGFKRWQKHGMDRLYINCESYGCEFDYYNSGNISSARFNGEKISNSLGRKFLATKVWVDVDTEELHIQTNTDFEDEIEQNVRKALGE